MTERTDNMTPESWRERLDGEAAELDSDQLRALRLARHRALDAAGGRQQGPSRWLLPGGAMAAGLAAVALAFVMMPSRDSRTVAPPGDSVADVDAAVPPVTSTANAVIADLDLLVEDNELAMIEDLDFLAWLSTVEEDIS